MTETQLRAKLHGLLRNRNCIVIPQVPNQYGAFGVPDARFVHNYWRGWCEAKREYNDPSPAQRDMVKLLSERGDSCCFLWFLSDDWNEQHPELNTLRVQIHHRGLSHETVSDPTNLLADLRSITAELQDKYLESQRMVIDALNS